jgi:hypothetical protein
MNYNEINELLEKILNTQKILAESPPSLPKDPLYIFLRIFFCGIIILGIAIYEIDYRKKFKISGKTRNFHELFRVYACIFGIFFIISFFANFLLYHFHKTQNDYFVPFEFLQLKKEKEEYVFWKNKALKNKEEILQKVNLITKNNPKIEDLENAKKFIEKQYNAASARKKKEEDLWENINSAVKNEIFETLSKQNFPISLNESQVDYMIYEISTRVRKPELFQEIGKRIEEEMPSNVLPESFVGNLVVERYMNGIADKVRNEIVKE